MAYIAIKPCRFAGQSFKVGESVPAEVIQPGAAKNLVKMGIIAEGEGATVKAPVAKPTIKEPEITVIIHADDGDLPLNPTPKGLQSVFDVLTSTANNAEAIIEKMTDGDALILLNATDSRKSIKALTEERATSMLKREGEQ